MLFMLKAIIHTVSNSSSEEAVASMNIAARFAKFRAANEDPINNSSSVFRGSSLKCFRKRPFDMQNIFGRIILSAGDSSCAG